jgi:hypothetical protein
MDDRSFEETYAQMLDGELARILRARRTLVPEARAALDKEIQKRQIDPEKLRKQRPHNIDGPKRPTTAEKRLKGKRLRLPWMLAVMALSVVLLSFLDHFGVEQLFWPTCITIAVPVFTVWGFWELKCRLWFWVTLALVAAANVVLFSFVGWPWGTHWVPGRAIAGLCTLELIPIFAFIARLEKRMGRDRNGKLRSPIPEPHSSPADKMATSPVEREFQ